MTILIDPEADEAAPSPKRGPTWKQPVAICLVLVVVAAGIGLLSYVHSYQPLSFGGVSGFHDPKVLYSDGSGEVDTLVGPTGSSGVLYYAVANNGHFGVHVDGLGATTELMTAHWSTARTPNPSRELGRVRDARAFPVTIPPGGAIILQVAITQPDCRASGLRNRQISSLPLRWSALGVGHIWNLNLADGTAPGIQICPSKSVQAQLVHRRDH